jgi:hypothetical protein
MADVDRLDLSKPPFKVIEGEDARAVANDLIACFQVISRLPEKVGTCVRAAFESAAVAPDEPLRIASCRIADDMDAGVGAGGANAYHNAQHFCEVLLNALYLSLLAKVHTQGKAEILVAALVHDFHHDGTKNMSATFRLESLSAQATAPYLEAAGVSPQVCARIAAMVFATEVTKGTRFARDCHLHFATGAALPPASGLPAPLALVGTDASLALEAVIVGEADVLSSAGLTVQYGELQQERLAEEWKQPLGAEHKLRFLNQVFQDFTVGRFFSPNLRDLKSAAQDRAARERKDDD